MWDGSYAYAIAGALTGFIVGLTGVGGGALMTPILLLFFDVAPVTAVATDLWFAVATKLVATALHGKTGRVDWPVVRRLWAGSLPVSLLVVLLVHHGEKIPRVHGLSQMIGVVVVVTAMGLLFAPSLQNRALKRRVGNPENFLAIQSSLTMMAGALLGVCVALTSVGAGALGSVLLLYLYPQRLTPQRLVATDIIHAIPLAMVAGSGYLLAGLVDGPMLLNLLSGSIPAVILGSLFSLQLDSRWLRIALALVLFAVGIKTFV
ncbi:MAG: sulfite exporter TauE/SafE family protein [Magnetococcales bacterium]|nr:sulfite exporter TauE/SafE family protein [Magnetococcales bacterium]